MMEHFVLREGNCRQREYCNRLHIFPNFEMQFSIFLKNEKNVCGMLFLKRGAEKACSSFCVCVKSTGNGTEQRLSTCRIGMEQN